MPHGNTAYSNPQKDIYIYIYIIYGNIPSLHDVVHDQVFPFLGYTAEYRRSNVEYRTYNQQYGVFGRI